MGGWKWGGGVKRVPTVAIVGRPNVGKSTLFNRIAGGRRAIVHAMPGVTRDVQRHTTEWNGVAFEIVDTGGLFSGVDDVLVSKVEARALAEVTKADAIIFVTDARDGRTGADQEVAEKIRASGVPVLLAVNKAESRSARSNMAGEFYGLGYENVYELSALHGEGVGDLLDDLVAFLPRYRLAEVEPDLKLAVVGVPNVGKSSIVNMLVGEEANIVDERPGTTRDSIDVAVRWHNRRITLVDTAGIKRKARSHDDITVISALKSLESIERCDVALVVLDASRPISAQDVKVGSYAHKNGKGILVCFNKWDLVEKGDRTYREFELDYKERFAFMSYAPTLFVSALTGQRMDRIFTTAWRIKEAREKRLPTAEFNRFIEDVSRRSPPPYHSGGTGKIYYGTQVEVSPPTFSLFVNKADYFARNYIRYLNNQIRDAFSFEGTLIRINLVQKKRGGASQR